VPLFAPDDSEAGGEPYDPGHTHHDWRFHLPVRTESRVLELGTRRDDAAVALAYESESVVALRAHATDAIRLDAHRQELALRALTAVATPLGGVPVANRSVDVAVLHNALGQVAAASRSPLDAQRRLLRTVFRRLVPGGLLWAEVPNRFDPRNLLDAWRDSGAHGLGGTRALLENNGFPHHRVFGVFRVDGRREIVPLDDGTVFGWVLRDRSPLARRLARGAFRAGVMPHFAASFAVIATRGEAK
jgi:SAM-dependent methyltransferase